MRGKFDKRTLFLISLAVFIAILVLQAPAFGEALLLDSALTISEPATFDSVVITSTGILTADAPIEVLGNMTIQSGGIVTHSLRLLSGLVLNVTGTLQVGSGGLIDVTAKGLKGGSNGSIYGGYGEAFDPVADTIMAGAHYSSATDGCGAGGSYGGMGGVGHPTTTTPNSEYGLIESPHYLGSGGGAGLYGADGRHGGGRVTISAGTCIVDGIIRANGGNTSVGSYGTGGAGSGGTIYLSIGTLSGSGTIQALGGNGASNSGSGGGGRIAVYYSTMTLPLANIGAYGGPTARIGSPGSIYLKDSAEAYGDLIFSNNNYASGQWTSLRTALTTLKSLTINKRALLHIASVDVSLIAVEQPVVLTNTAQFKLEYGVTLAVSNATGFDIDAQSASIMTLDTGSILNLDAIRFNGATLNTNIDLSFPVESDLEFSGGSTLNILDSTIFSVGTLTPGNFQEGTVNLPAGSQLEIAANYAVIDSGVTLIKDGSFGASDQIDNMTIQSGGIVTHSLRLLSGLVLNVTGTLQVETGGLIDVTAKGLKGGSNGSIYGGYGEAFDPVTYTIVSGAANAMGGAGGSYGGLGGLGYNSAEPNELYGIMINPQHLGSGGGGGSNGADGGHGGGRMTIVAGTCIIDGMMKANGENSTANGWGTGGAGSGGSINISVGDLSGSGLIQAKGGNGLAPAFLEQSGAGGGGRIAIFYNTTSFPRDSVTASGGTGGRDGRHGTVLYAIAGGDYTQNSTTENVLVLSPADNVPFEVTLRDQYGMPVVGSANVWLDFSRAYGIVPCGLEAAWPIVYPTGTSDMFGKININTGAGGCTSDSVDVFTSYGKIATIPVKSLDHNGGLLVNASDFVGDNCNDYNLDGRIDYADYSYFAKHLGQSCLGDISQYFNLYISTSPGPGHIFQGDTIMVNAKIVNMLNEGAIVDSIDFYTAWWGIAQPWARFSHVATTPIGPRDSITASAVFIVPPSGHGCFRVKMYPRLTSKSESADSRRESGCEECLAYDIEYTEQPIGSLFCPVDPDYPNYTCGGGLAFDILKIKSRYDCDSISGDCTGASVRERIIRINPCNYNPIKTGLNCVVENYNGDLNPECDDGYWVCLDPSNVPEWWNCTETWMQQLIVCGHVVKTIYMTFHYSNNENGCNVDGPANREEIPGEKPPCEPPEKVRQRNIDARPAAGLRLQNGTAGQALRTSEGVGSVISQANEEFLIPLGTEYGDSLELSIISQMPEMWSYIVSDTGWVLTPDTLTVTVIHDSFVNPADTGRIILNAYNSCGDFAGTAELWIFSDLICGDANSSGTVNILDVTYLLAYLYQGGPAPNPIQVADVNGNGMVNILDITYIIAYLYKDGPAPQCP